MRNEYALTITINHKIIRRVIIDQHYRENQSESIDDGLILNLIKVLDGEILDVEIERDGFQYFKVEPIYPEYSRCHPYRLILVICIHDDYVGVINAFRVNRR
jgi:hypothetical protein